MKAGYYFILFLLSGIIIFGCKPIDEEKKINNKVKVKTVIVQKKTIQIKIHSSGKLSSKTEMKLSFKTGGIINKIMVDEGSFVRKGMVLAQLDLSGIQARVEQSKLGYEKAKRDLDRAKNLYDDSVATLEQYQNAKTTLDLAKSNIQIANFNLKYSTIKAPANGKILKRLVEANEIIGAGNHVFLFASTEKDWILRTNVTDKDIVKLKLSDSAHIRFDPYPNKTFLAFISEVGNFADPYTGTYEIELRLEKSDHKFASGFIGKVDIYSSEKKNLFAIPIETLVDATESTGYVYKIVDNKVLKQKVGIENILEKYLLVNSGISENDEIITEGAYYLKPGSEIEIVNE